MKRFLVIVAVLLGLYGVRAQGTDDQYINIHSLIQEADSLNSGGQPSEALPKYLQAQTALQQFKKVYPEWNPNVITFRLNYVAAKIAEVSPRVVTATNRLAPAAVGPPRRPNQPRAIGKPGLPAWRIRCASCRRIMFYSEPKMGQIVKRF